MGIRPDNYSLPRKYDRRYKTTEEDVLAMKRMYIAGISQRTIARIFGISQSAVSYIVSKHAKAGLAEYRRSHPSKRRTKEEDTIYHRELRSYKKGLIVREREGNKEAENNDKE